MKRLILIVMLLVIAALTACSQDAPGSSSTANENCNKHGCVSIEIEQPVQAMKPANLRIKVSSTQKTDHLAISLTIIGLESLKIEKLPEPTRSVQYKDNDLGVSIVIDAEASQEYVIEGEVVLAKPAYQAEMYSYGFFLVTVTPTGAIVRTSASIYLDSEGNQVDAEQVKEYREYYKGTEVIFVPVETGIIDFPTFTPAPTFPPPTPVPSATPMPTRTPTPTRTATQAPYP
ncbi:MAG: hypothetical protein AB1453_00705 [Chloroflexota bacterium]